MRPVFSRLIMVILAVTANYSLFAAEAPDVSTPPTSDVGGGWVRWRADGKELFYTEADGNVMSVGLTFSDDGKTFTAAAPVRLFNAPMNASPENNAIAQQYMVSADGQRFLVIAATGGDSPVHLHTP